MLDPTIAPVVVSSGPTWYLVATISGGLVMFLLGIVIALVAGYAKGQSGRIDKLEDAYKRLNDMVLSQYLNKDETNKLLNDVKQLVISLQGRFDMLLMQQSNQPHPPQ